MRFEVEKWRGREGCVGMRKIEIEEKKLRDKETWVSTLERMASEVKLIKV